MRINLAGINHQTAPVAIREKTAIASGKLDDALHMLKIHISRGIILSTCNRTEVYTIDNDDSRAEKTILEFFRTRLDIPDTTLRQFVYLFKDKSAVEHLYRVASGMESMIVGEYEVLGQVGYALKAAEDARMVNLPLRYIFQSAIRTGRRAREETEISRNALSISSVAVDLAAGIVGDLSRCKMLVIGTGEAGELVAKAARDRGVFRTVVAGRTLERASALAERLGGKPISSSNLSKELLGTDIVITCSGAPHRVISLGQVKQAVQKRPDNPLVIIDIAVPRNVEPAVSRINNVFLYNIDDITSRSGTNYKKRESEIQKAEYVVADELDKFTSWWQEYKVRPVIRAMMSKAEKIRRMHLEHTMKKLPRLTEEEQYSLEMMTRAIISKVLKDPISNLKANGHTDHNYTETVKHLFRLDIEDLR